MILLIGLSIYIWVRFSKLSFSFDKPKTKYSLYALAYFIGLGYGLQFLTGIVLALTGNFELAVPKFNQLFIALICELIGGLVVIAYYRFLERRWESEKSNNGNLLDDTSF